MEDLKAESESMDSEQMAHRSPQNERKRKSLGDDQLAHDLEKDGECREDAAVSLSKKKRKEEAEAMDAETQRLLRESKKVAFPEGQLQRKPISSILEKMRQRKLERAQKSRSAQQSVVYSSKRPLLNMKKALPDDSSLNMDMDDDIELVMVKPPTQQVLEVEQEPDKPSATSKFRSLQNIATYVGSVEETTRPGTPETRSEACRADKPSVMPSKRENLTRPHLIESQDLYSDSQLSPIRDESPDERGAVNNIPIPELDYETQTEDCSSPEEDEEKENKDPTGLEGLPTVSLVRGLIDDEAEDEDEDLLEDEAEEDEDAAEDLRDLLAHDVTEKPADRKRRADLHRKWLEQQDISMTDSILNRMESGWRNRVKKQRLPGILDETQDNVSRRSTLQASGEAVHLPAEPAVDNSPPTGLEKTSDKAKHPAVKRERSSEPEVIIESNEFDDDEEDEQFRRQRLLNESEEQSELPSVHDDETSRQIFSLINKVNVATVKPIKVSTGISDIRPLGMVHHHSLSHVQSSFARRTVTTVQTTTRQGSGNSRSYIFGRDDSNSNPSSRFQQNEPKSGRDSSPATDAVDNFNSSRISSTPRGGSLGAKGREPKSEETTGPSLFQILKQQAADLERSVLTRDSSFSLNGSSSRSGDLSIFSVMRPSKPSRKSRD